MPVVQTLTVAITVHLQWRDSQQSESSLLLGPSPTETPSPKPPSIAQPSPLLAEILPRVSPALEI